MRRRVRVAVLLSIVVVLLAGSVPILETPIPSAVIQEDGRAAGTCLELVRVDGRDSWSRYPDTLHLRSEPDFRDASWARALTDASDGMPIGFWIQLAGDSVELRAHHMPTIRLSGGSNPSGSSYSYRDVSLLGWIVARLRGAGSAVLARAVVCPQSAPRAS